MVLLFNCFMLFKKNRIQCLLLTSIFFIASCSSPSDDGTDEANLNANEDIAAGVLLSRAVSSQAEPNGLILSPSSDLNINVGDAVNFASTGDRPASDLIFIWNFAGATLNSAQQNPPAVTFKKEGIFKVTLRVKDKNTGVIDSTPGIRIITVGGNNPTGPANKAPAGAILSPSNNVTINAGDVVRFAGSGSDPDNNIPLTYQWLFDGGVPVAGNQASTQQSPGDVRFASAGIYTVKLTVTDALLLSDPTPIERIVTVVSNSVNTAPDGRIIAPSNNMTINEGESIFFASSVSDQENNGPFSFVWDFNGGAAAPTSQQNPGTVTFNQAGTYAVSLIVSDNQNLADPIPAIRTITVKGNTPTANTAPNGTILAPSGNMSIKEGESIFFAGTGSDSDPNSTLTYIWNFDGGALNSAKQNPGQVTFLSAGTYNITLRARDDKGLIDPTPAIRTITVIAKANANQAPIGSIIKPASNMTIDVNSGIVFEGSGIDPDNNTPLSYFWDFGGGATNANGRNPGSVTFTKTGVFTVSLAVKDGTGLADGTPARRVITVIDPQANNLAPNSIISSPSKDLVIDMGQSVLFSGVGVDPDNNTPLSYAWNFAGAVPNSNQQNPGAVTFNEPGTYRVKLTVKDSSGLVDSTPAERVIVVTANSPTNVAPDSVIISPQAASVTIPVGEAIFFSGMGFDIDGNIPLMYSWNFGGAAPNETRQRPGEIVFSQPGKFTVTLTVKDSLGKADLSPAVREITVLTSSNNNQMPNGIIASPTGPFTINEGESISFAGSGSDPDNNIPLSYAWNFDGARPNVNVQNPGVLAFPRAGIYRVKLTITDSLGLSDSTPDERVITVRSLNTTNQPPSGTIVTPSRNLTVDVGSTLDFTATGSDPDGDTPLKYFWNFDGAVPNVLQKTPGAVTFNQAGTYRIRLTVEDSKGLKDMTPEEVTITVLNTANNNQAPNGTIITPTMDVVINEGDTLTFRGTAFDPEGDSNLLYQWDFDGAVPNSDAHNPGNVTFTAPGTFRVRLVVVDSLGLADPMPAERIITVRGNAVNSLAPNGVIVTPVDNMVIDLGTTLLFTGEGNDPDSGLPLSYFWNLDGAMPNSNQQNAGPVTFNKLGTYRISLWVTGADGVMDPTPAERVITVQDGNSPLGNFAPAGAITKPQGDMTIFVGDTLTFAGTGSDADKNLPLSYRWNFDGAAANLLRQDPGNITFNRVGTFRVTLTVTDGLGLSDPTPVQRVITVRTKSSANIAPNGSILTPAQNLTVNVGDSIHFSGTGSDADGHLPLRYLWDFAGVAPLSFNETPGNILFTQAGVYRVKLIVIDRLGLADSFPAERTITVVDTGNQPTGNLVPFGNILSPAEDVTIAKGEALYFTATGGDPDGNLPLLFVWNFDGAVPNVTTQKPGDVTFGQIGTFNVSLIVKDSLGAISQADVRTITVLETLGLPNQAPDGAIVTPASDMTIMVGDVVNFRANGTDPDFHLPLSYSWTFSGGIASGLNVQNMGDVVFDQPGTYTIKLTVTDARGKSDPTPAIRRIIVEDANIPTGNLPPNGSILSPSTNVVINAGDSLLFTGFASDPNGNTPLSYFWNFDGATLNTTKMNPGAITFKKKGTFDIILIVTDSLGLRDPTPDRVTVMVR